MTAAKDLDTCVMGSSRNRRSSVVDGHLSEHVITELNIGVLLILSSPSRSLGSIMCKSRLEVILQKPSASARILTRKCTCRVHEHCQAPHFKRKAETISRGLHNAGNLQVTPVRILSQIAPHELVQLGVLVRRNLLVAGGSWQTLSCSPGLAVTPLLDIACLQVTKATSTWQRNFTTLNARACR